MNRLTVLYILMTACFMLGLWGILRFGRDTLTAREDLAGEWILVPLSGTAGATQSLRIEQSGRYCNLHFASGPSLRMKMVDEIANSDRKLVRLSGDDGQITCSGKAETWQFTLVGKVQGDWDATLVSRTYPRAKPASRPTKAS